MSRIKIISVGKTKESWLDEAIAEYLKRLQPWAIIEFIWAKNDTQLLQLIQKETFCLCLDAAGRTFTSQEFSRFFQEKLVKGGSKITLVIGGPEGLPDELKEKHALISLSTMTFTHQIARLILVEQIYRAYTIFEKLPYHK